MTTKTTYQNYVVVTGDERSSMRTTLRIAVECANLLARKDTVTAVYQLVNGAAAILVHETVVNARIAELES